MSERPIRIRRAMTLAAAVGGGVIDAAYLRLISEQGSGFGSRVVFIAGYIALMTALALAGAILHERDDAASRIVLLGAASGFVAVGIIALFSIGSALILVGVLTLAGAGPARVSRLRAAASIVGSVALLAIGLALTS